jgi:hypothetical protein
VVSLNLTCGDACSEPLTTLSPTFLSSLQNLSALEYFSLQGNNVGGQLLAYSGALISLQNLQVSVEGALSSSAEPVDQPVGIAVGGNSNGYTKVFKYRKEVMSRQRGQMHQYNPSRSAQRDACLSTRRTVHNIHMIAKIM